MPMHVSQLVLKMICDTDLVQDSTFEDMMSCSDSNKPLDLQNIWSICQTKLCKWMFLILFKFM